MPSRHSRHKSHQRVEKLPHVVHSNGREKDEAEAEAQRRREEEEASVDRLIRRRNRLKAKLENTSLRLARKKSAQTRRRTRVAENQAALPDDALHRAHNSVHAASHRDSNFTKGLLQSGYRGPGAYVTEKRQAFVHYDVDPAERALLARDYRPQGEFSHFLNRCISQCYEKRRGIEDPRGRVVAISSSAFATAPSKPKPGQKSKYIGLQLAPVVPERYGSTATIGVHNNAQWQGVHPKPMNLAFVNDYKRQKEKEKLKGFLNSAHKK